MLPPLSPLPTQPRARRGTSTASPPTRFINASDGTTVSALSNSGSPASQAGIGVESSLATISNDNHNFEGMDEDLAEAIEQFLQIDDEGGDGGDSDEEGDEFIIHTNGVLDDTNRATSDVEYSPEDDHGEVRGQV